MADPERWHLSKAVPVSIIAFLAFQTVGIVIWAVKLDARVGTLEVDKATHETSDNKKQDEQDKRLGALEALGPRLAVIEARQQDVIKRLDNNAGKLDDIVSALRGLKPHNGNQ